MAPRSVDTGRGVERLDVRVLRVCDMAGRGVMSWAAQPQPIASQYSQRGGTALHRAPGLSNQSPVVFSLKVLFLKSGRHALTEIDLAFSGAILLYSISGGSAPSRVTRDRVRVCASSCSFYLSPGHDAIRHFHIITVRGFIVDGVISVGGQGVLGILSPASHGVLQGALGCRNRCLDPG